MRVCALDSRCAGRLPYGERCGDSDLHPHFISSQAVERLGISTGTGGSQDWTSLHGVVGEIKRSVRGFISSSQTRHNGLGSGWYCIEHGKR